MNNTLIDTFTTYLQGLRYEKEPYPYPVPKPVEDKLITTIPQIDHALLMHLNLLEYRAVVAGGCALRWWRGHPVGANDVDVWFTNLVDLNLMTSYLRKSHSVVADTPNAITFNATIDNRAYKIQLIKKLYKTIPDMLDNFDITVCKVATDGTQWFCHDDFAVDVRDRVLRVTKMHPHIVRRVIKYWSYGYQPDDTLLEQIIAAPDVQWSFDNSSFGEEYDNA